VGVQAHTKMLYWNVGYLLPFHPGYVQSSTHSTVEIIEVQSLTTHPVPAGVSHGQSESVVLQTPAQGKPLTQITFCSKIKNCAQGVNQS
jgi:hypothetical protein